jgi:hypothetical protein
MQEADALVRAYDTPNIASPDVLIITPSTLIATNCDWFDPFCSRRRLIISLQRTAQYYWIDLSNIHYPVLIYTQSTSV